MSFKIEPPTNDKEGLRNQLKTIANCLELGNAAEAQCQLNAVIDDLAPDYVRFEWMSTAARKLAAKDQARGIAAYCAANPWMVD